MGEIQVGIFQLNCSVWAAGWQTDFRTEFSGAIGLLAPFSPDSFLSAESDALPMFIATLGLIYVPRTMTYLEPPQSIICIFKLKGKSMNGSMAMVLAAVVIVACDADAQTNSWTSPVSGNWQDLTWSLGVRPDISQAAIMLTNDGQKSVVISPSTVNFPASLVISNLTVAGTPSSTNTLVVDCRGTQTKTPVQIFNSCTVGSNGVLVNLEGVISLQGSNALLEVIGAGIVNIIGGSLSANSIVVDRPIGRAAAFFQGGNAEVTADSVGVGIGPDGASSYYLTNGSLLVQQGTGVRGIFTQFGGTHKTPSLDLGGFTGEVGEYVLNAGFLVADTISLVGPFASIVQSGGTNLAQTCEFNSTGGYTFSGGTLISSNTRIFGGGSFSGFFSQTGGLHVISNTLGISGIEGRSVGQYDMSDGSLICTSIGVDGYGYFNISGGAVNCLSLTLNPYFNFSAAPLNDSGGSIMCVNLDIETNRVFNHSGGNLTCGNINLAGSTNFGVYGALYHSGGTLACGNITLWGGTNRDAGKGKLSHTGGTFTNSGQIVFSGGSLQADNVTEQLGSIVLTADSNDTLGSNPCIQHFAPSALNPWSSGATLQIIGWNGSPTGNGRHQIYVGNDSSGLTLSQLSQIRFGSAFATILGTGEIVPAVVPPIPSLCVVKMTNAVVLNWQTQNTNTWSLQFSTNVMGPWFDTVNAISSFECPIAGNEQYFRLRYGPTWLNTDLGYVYSPGSSVYSNGTFTVQSFGYDCWDTADQFQCIYQPVTGDATLTAHIASLQLGDQWAKAGVMFRNDLGGGAQNAATILTPGNGAILQRRTLASHGTSYIQGPNLQAPCWLRIVRRGDVFSNYVSTDGANWTLIGSADTVTMGATAYAVLFVTTHSLVTSVSETAVFDSVSVTQP